jgi:hypothetical protein
VPLSARKGKISQSFFYGPFSDCGEKGFFMDTETAKERVSRGVFYGFVPHRLEIETRPELNVFPFNVMFMQFMIENGKTISGTALYEPDFGSYKQDGEVSSMEYHNKYGPANWLVIEYDRAEQSYIGKKFVNGGPVGEGYGKEWNMFFVHFTALGLANGERCMFDDVPSKAN